MENMDKILKTFKYKGMSIVIMYNGDYFKGYVSVSNGTELYKVNYDDLKIRSLDEITYSDGNGMYPIPSIGLWWFGFHTEGKKTSLPKVVESCVVLADELSRINNHETVFKPADSSSLTIMEKCELFRQEVEMNKKRESILMDCLMFLEDVKAVMVDSKKYVKIDYTLTNGQQCGLFMVDKETGFVYGIRGYGKANKNKLVKRL